MYLLFRQYPGLEGLSKEERDQIFIAAMSKYDRWWGLRWVVESMLLLLLPVAALLIGFLLGEMDLINATKSRQVVSSFAHIEYIVWGCGAFTTAMAYLRMVNSGLDQTVKTYLEVEKIAATICASSQSGPVDSGFALKKRINGYFWLTVYVLVLVASSSFWLMNFGEVKKTKPIPVFTPFLNVSVVKLNSNFERLFNPQCKLVLSLHNTGVQTVDDLLIEVTLHPNSGDTISTNLVRFQYVDPGKTGTDSLGLLSDRACLETVVVRFRRISVCEIGGENYRDCQMLIHSEPSERNLLELP